MDSENQGWAIIETESKRLKLKMESDKKTIASLPSKVETIVEHSIDLLMAAAASNINFRSSIYEKQL